MSARRAAGAVDELPERAEVRVVLEAQRQAEPARQLGSGPNIGPLTQDRRRGDRLRPPVDRRGEAHADAQYAASVDPRLGEQPRHQRRAGVEGRTRSGVHVEIDPALRHDRRREIGNRDTHVPVPEVEPRRGIEAQPRRRRAAPARP
jgi:hypothetical protein